MINDKEETSQVVEKASEVDKQTELMVREIMFNALDRKTESILRSLRIITTLIVIEFFMLLILLFS